MTNHEVLAVNQDRSGKAAGAVSSASGCEVWARPLADGTMAVGLFNRGLQPAKMTATWTELGLRGRQPVRDLWPQRISAQRRTVLRHRARATARCSSRLGSDRSGRFATNCCHSS